MNLDDRTAYAKVELSNTDKNLLSRLEKNEFMGALLGCGEDREEMEILLLDQRKDGVYERIGTVCIKNSPVFHGVLVEAEHNLRDIEKRIGSLPLDVEVEDWKLEKTWRRLRLG